MQDDAVLEEQAAAMFEDGFGLFRPSWWRASEDFFYARGPHAHRNKRDSARTEKIGGILFLGFGMEHSLLMYLLFLCRGHILAVIFVVIFLLCPFKMTPFH